MLNFEIQLSRRIKTSPNTSDRKKHLYFREYINGEKIHSSSCLRRQKLARGISMNYRRWFPEDKTKRKSSTLVLELKKSAKKQREDGTNSYMVKKVINFNLKRRRKKYTKSLDFLKKNPENSKFKEDLNIHNFFKIHQRFQSTFMDKRGRRALPFLFQNNEKKHDRNEVYDRVKMTLESIKNSKQESGKRRVENLIKKRKEAKERYENLLPVNKYKNYQDLAKGVVDFNVEKEVWGKSTRERLERSERIVGKLNRMLMF